MGPLRVKFWGTRGLVPSPRKTTAIFGGNTTCIQVLHDNYLIIVDTGYGVALLGESLVEKIVKEKQKLEVHIFFSHFHWDHILGLPFFHPIYFPSTQLHLYAPATRDQTWKSLDILFDGSYSPFAGIDRMPSKILFHQLVGPITIGDMAISFAALEHHIHGNERQESQTYAYRFDCEKYSLVVASDHEAKEGAANDSFVKFAKNASILIHDAQYTEKDPFVGWGHSTVTQALNNARRIQSTLTLLTHHDPQRDDDEILALDAEYKKKPEFSGLNFEFAREGAIYDPSKF